MFEISGFTGYIMRKDTEVVTIENGVITNFSNIAPLAIQRGKDFAWWLKNRSSDIERSNMRLLRRVLGIPLRAEEEAVLFVDGGSVTDDFWIKQKDSEKVYADTVLKRNKYFSVSFSGNSNSLGAAKKGKPIAPDITTKGVLEKGWQRRDCKWVLFKRCSDYDIFCEVFASCLGRLMGFDAVKYEYSQGCVKCESFTNGWSLEHYKSIDDEVEDYEKTAINIEKLGGSEGLKKYLDMLYLDALVRNFDRHEENFGFLTDNNGVVKFAPIYDNNNSLWRDSNTNNSNRDDILVRDFISVAKKYEYKVKNSKEISNYVALSYKNISQKIRDIYEYTSLSGFVLKANDLILEGLE